MKGFVGCLYRWLVFLLLAMLNTMCSHNHEAADQGHDVNLPLHAGFRASRYGVKPFPKAEYWGYVAVEMSRRCQSAKMGGVWIVGVFLDDGSCELNFPSPGQEYPNIHFLGEDQNEEYLDYFDNLGVSLWLQVEPGNADLPTLIDLVLNRYGHHPSVNGFGVDVEWLQYSAADEDGKAVTDAEAEAWHSQVKSHNAGYTLFLKHWLTDHMPPTFRRDIFFISDSCEFGSLVEMMADFSDWGAHFAPHAVGFQIGYESDRFWWKEFPDPPAAIGMEIVRQISNARGVFWVDFTITDIFPDSRAPQGNGIVQSFE